MRTMSRWWRSRAAQRSRRANTKAFSPAAATSIRSRATVVVPLSGALTAASNWAIGTVLFNKGDDANRAEMTAEKDGEGGAASVLEMIAGVAGVAGSDSAGNASHGGEPRTLSPCGPGINTMELRRRRMLRGNDGVRSNVEALVLAS